MRSSQPIIIRKIISPLWAWKDGSSHLQHLINLERSQYWSAEKLKELQFDRLKKIVAHAYKHSPYYKKLYQDHGVSPNTLQSLADIKKFPLISKEIIQQNAKQMIADNYDSKKLIADMTGGSTGSPLHFYYDKERWAIRTATTIRHDRWTGWDIGEWNAYLWAAQRDIDKVKKAKASLRNWLLGRSILLNTANVDVGDLARFTDELKKKDVKYFIGYASSLYLFAKYIAGINEKEVRPQAIISSAEVLDQGQKNFIESVFGCKVFNRYGCRELSMLASECACHEGLHVNDECVYLETLPIAKGSSRGEIIVTDLLNFGMPMIRYQIKDVGQLSEKPCSCGRGLSLLSSIRGRVSDFILTPEGKLVSGPSITITTVAKTKGLIQAQVIQERQNLLVFKLVVDEKFDDESINFLKEKCIEYFGPKMKIDFEFVEHISREASGKYRFSISKIANEFLLNGSF